MKKRLCLILTLVIITVLAVIPFTACTDDGEYALKTDKKYIRESDINQETSGQNYVLFRTNGTGEYKYLYISSVSSDYNEDYKINFKYVYADSDKSTVICLFDSIQFGKNHPNNITGYYDWSKMFTVSKDVVCSVGGTGYTMYINEDFIKEIPNFGE